MKGATPTCTKGGRGGGGYLFVACLKSCNHLITHHPCETGFNGLPSSHHKAIAPSLHVTGSPEWGERHNYKRRATRSPIPTIVSL